MARKRDSEGKLIRNKRAIHLERNKERVIELVLAGYSTAEIAEDLGVSWHSVWKYQSDDYVREKVHEYFRQAQRTASEKFQDKIPAAIRALEMALRDENGHVRVKAATALLDRAGILAGQRIVHEGELAIGQMTPEEVRRAATNILLGKHVHDEDQESDE